MQLVDLIVLVIGVLLVVRAVLSALRTFVVPRPTNDLIARTVFISLRRVFDFVVSRLGTYERRDRLMSYFGPTALVTLPVVWIILVGAGYTLIFWALGARQLDQAILDSGSSLLTLGFAKPEAFAGDMVAFSEAVIGLGLVALLIAYLPTIYAAFSRRELLVRQLETRADYPPSPVIVIGRLYELDGFDELHDLWARWEEWFAELEETHTSLTVLVHFRSQEPGRSWVGAAGAMLDTAALVRSSVAIPSDAHSELMIRAGSAALRRITAVFHLPFDPSPGDDSPTRVDRATFDAALDALRAWDVPLTEDVDAAWGEFRRLRVTYDEPLLRLEQLTVAPDPWWLLPISGPSATSVAPAVTALPPGGPG